MAAHRPEKIGTAAENLEFVAIKHVEFGQLIEIACVKDIARDPVEGLQVALAALAVLDVGLDQIA